MFPYQNIRCFTPCLNCLCNADHQIFKILLIILRYELMKSSLLQIMWCCRKLSNFDHTVKATFTEKSSQTSLTVLSFCSPLRSIFAKETFIQLIIRVKLIGVFSLEIGYSLLASPQMKILKSSKQYLNDKNSNRLWLNINLLLAVSVQSSIDWSAIFGQMFLIFHPIVNDRQNLLKSNRSIHVLLLAERNELYLCSNLFIPPGGKQQSPFYSNGLLTIPHTSLTWLVTLDFEWHQNFDSSEIWLRWTWLKRCYCYWSAPTVHTLTLVYIQSNFNSI